MVKINPNNNIVFNSGIQKKNNDIKIIKTETKVYEAEAPLPDIIELDEQSTPL